MRFPLNFGKFLIKRFLHIFSPPLVVGVIAAAKLHSAKSELRFCTGSNPVRGVLEIHVGEDLRQWPRLDMRLNSFHWSTIPQNNSSSSSRLGDYFCRKYASYLYQTNKHNSKKRPHFIQASDKYMLYKKGLHFFKTVSNGIF